MAPVIRDMAVDLPEATKQPPPSPAVSTCSTALPFSPTVSPREMPPSPGAMPDAVHDLIANAVFEAAATTPPTPSSSEVWQEQAASDAETPRFGKLTVLKWITIFVAWLFAGTAIFVASQLAFFLYQLILLPATACLRALVPAGLRSGAQHMAQ